MLTRRTQEPITPRKLIEEVVYSPLDWPGKTVRLEPSTLESYCQRSTAARISVAELYHENSKLFPAMVADLTAVRVDHTQVRHEFLWHRSELRAEDKTVQLNSGIAELVNKIVPAIQPELFYAIELRFFQSGMLASYEPLSRQLHLTKRLTVADTERLNDAIELMGPADQSGGDLIFVIGNFARNDLLFGVRGYRRTLIEAGRVTEKIRELAVELKLAPRVRLEFADRVADEILECDGVEEGILAVVELGEIRS
jgi:hypothetical protein